MTRAKAGKDSKTKAKRVSLSARAGLTFPVGRIQRHLKNRTSYRRVDLTAAINMAASLEYLTGKVLQIAGNASKDLEAKRITPYHLKLAIREDEELFSLTKATIAGGAIQDQLNDSQDQIQLREDVTISQFHERSQDDMRNIQTQEDMKASLDQMRREVEMPARQRAFQDKELNEIKRKQEETNDTLKEIKDSVVIMEQNQNKTMALMHTQLSAVGFMVKELMSILAFHNENEKEFW